MDDEIDGHVSVNQYKFKIQNGLAVLFPTGSIYTNAHPVMRMGMLEGFYILAPHQVRLCVMSEYGIINREREHTRRTQTKKKQQRQVCVSHPKETSSSPSVSSFYSI
jgi:hypothetical protein